MSLTRANLLTANIGLENKQEIHCLDKLLSRVSKAAKKHKQREKDSIGNCDSEQTVSKLKKYWKRVENLDVKKVLAEAPQINRYLEHFLKNIVICLKFMLNLFERSGGESDEMQLSKLTMRLMYIYDELTALVQVDDLTRKFECSYKEATLWWERMFPDWLSVTWPRFILQFSNDFKIRKSEKIEQLHDTINFTSDAYVSIYSWDLFTRLFCPWERLIQVWTKIVREPSGFVPWISFKEMHKVLSNYRSVPGTYALRMSCTKTGYWVLAYVDDKRQVLQTICQQDSPETLLEKNLRDKKIKTPVGCDQNMSQTALNERTTIYHVATEKLELYSNRNSYQLCGICMDRNKTIKLIPCSHLLCKECADQWLSKSQTCPFCVGQVESYKNVQLMFDDAKRNQSLESVQNSSFRSTGRQGVGLPTAPNQVGKRKDSLYSTITETTDRDSGSSAWTISTRDSAVSSNMGSSTNVTLDSHKYDEIIDKAERLVRSGWSRQDVDRAIRVANGDVSMAESILQEFSSKHC